MAGFGSGTIKFERIRPRQIPRLLLARARITRRSEVKSRCARSRDHEGKRKRKGTRWNDETRRDGTGRDGTRRDATRRWLLSQQHAWSLALTARSLPISMLFTPVTARLRTAPPVFPATANNTANRAPCPYWTTRELRPFRRNDAN